MHPLRLIRPLRRRNLRPRLPPLSLPPFASVSGGNERSDMDQYVLSTDLEKRLVPQLIQLVLSPDGHRICLWEIGIRPN